MHRRSLFIATLLAISLFSPNAFAGVWFELLHAPCWTGNPADRDDFGRYKRSVDCFNDDFNGAAQRTTFSIKAFQAWEYGTIFLFYDITGPFTPANLLDVKDNEKGGFFGGTTVTVSAKKIAEKFAGGQPFNWGMLADLSVKYEMEHVSKFGMLHYYGLQWDLAVPFLDFLSATTVIRDDMVFQGIDFQLGAAWQKSFSLGEQDFIFAGFFQWGIFGEGAGTGTPFFEGTKGNTFFMSQPQLLYDFGKLIRFTPAKLYLGFEWQLALNRYLIQNKSEHTLQGMIRWNI